MKGLPTHSKATFRPHSPFMYRDYYYYMYCALVWEIFTWSRVSHIGQPIHFNGLLYVCFVAHFGWRASQDSLKSHFAAIAMWFCGEAVGGWSYSWLATQPAITCIRDHHKQSLAVQTVTNSCGHQKPVITVYRLSSHSYPHTTVNFSCSNRWILATKFRTLAKHACEWCHNSLHANSSGTGHWSVEILLLQLVSQSLCV